MPLSYWSVFCKALRLYMIVVLLFSKSAVNGGEPLLFIDWTLFCSGHLITDTQYAASYVQDEKVGWWWWWVSLRPASPLFKVVPLLQLALVNGWQTALCSFFFFFFSVFICQISPSPILLVFLVSHFLPLSSRSGIVSHFCRLRGRESTTRP